MKIKFIVFILITVFFNTFLSNKLYAQKEAANWNFGKNLSLKFDNKGITSNTVGNSDFFEGNSTISDKDGNLLLYTDGLTVYNRNKSIMKNGTGLQGSLNSIQSGIIIKIPNSDNLFFIFTTNEADNSGAKYSIVDLRLDNGLGEVTEKNISLFSDCTEKLTATLHQNKKDVWIVFHKWGNNQFFSYLITENGLNETPVISSVGTPHIFIDKFSDVKGEKRGAMKLNPQGNKIGLVNDLSGLIELFDFDNTNGVISNPINLLEIIEKFKPDSSIQFRKIFRPSFCEFSPNGKMFYFNSWNPFFNIKNRLFQIDIENINVNSKDDEYKLWTGEIALNESFGAMQLGIDCRLYISKGTVGRVNDDIYLHFIDNPNLKYNGNNLNVDSIVVGNSTNQIIWYGLPNFLTNYLDPEFINKEEFDYGKINTKIILPSQLGELGDLTYILPVNLTYQIPSNYIDNSFERTYKLQIKIKYNSLLFRSDKFSNNNIIDKKFEAENEILNLEFNNIKFNKEKDSIKIGEFLGYFLLSEIKESDIEILDYEWKEKIQNNTNNSEFKDVIIPTDTTLGKLIRSGICAENLRLLGFFQPTELNVFKEKNNSIIQVKTMSQGKFDLNIYDIEGKLIENILIKNNKNKDEICLEEFNLNEILLKTNRFSNSLCFIELIINGKKFTQKVIVEN